MNGYAHPEVLVETDWVKANLGRPGIRLVEVDVDTAAYDAGHIRGAVGFNWRTELQDQVGRDIIGQEAFEKLVGGAGISPRDTVILYGDNNNWFAANAFWLFKVYGHRDVRLMNGGRAKWQSEPDKGLTIERPNPQPVAYRVTEARPELRALLPDVLRAVNNRACNLVDVRSLDEFTGKVIAPPGLNETAQRGGHVPGARCIPWGTPVAPMASSVARNRAARGTNIRMESATPIRIANSTLTKMAATAVARTSPRRSAKPARPL
jgi:thiosulfate/3-mercaptopyruvate sulfurtransferase